LRELRVCKLPGIGATLKSGLKMEIPGDKYCGCERESAPMKIEKLEDLHQNINALRPLNLEDCAALIGEVWRLRIAQTGKDLEVSCWKDSHDQLKAELEQMTEANRLLQAENEQLKTMHGLPNCYLESRWSNCAVRMRKWREIDNNGNHVNGNHL
jgi:hypothetical protein